MIKFDKDVLQALKTLEKAGFETFATGDCVKDLIRGVYAYDWDLATAASAEDLERLFPEGKFIDEEKKTMRVDYTYEVEETEDTPAHMEGAIMDIHILDCTLEAELVKAPFTVQAMADNPDRRFVDPHGGRDDMKRKLIRSVGDADQLFKSQPARMLEAVAMASEMDFDLHKDVFDGILRNWRLLLDYDRTVIRENLERILTSEHAGKGLKLMAESGLMAVIFGEEVSKKMSHNDMRAFNVLCENIDRTRPVRLRRLGLLYTILSKKPGMEAIDRLEFSDEDKVYLYDAMTLMIDIQFLGEPVKFKRFLFEVGMDRYNYMHNLAKAQRIVYDQPTQRVESRNYAMMEIQQNQEPVFVEDLVIDANDIMEAGITDDPERAAELLRSVCALVHKKPQDNRRDVLLKAAKKYSKSKLAEQMRYIKWYR